MAYDWNNKNNSSNSSNNYNWNKGETLLQGVDKEKEQLRSKGLPVSSSKTQAAPGFLSSIPRTILKPFAEFGTSAINLGQVITGNEPTDVLSGDYLGKVSGLGEIDITKGLTPENVKTLKKSVSTGAEIASNLTYGGIAKGAVTPVLKQGVKEFAKTQGTKLLKEGALTGLASSLGYQGSQNAEFGTPISLKKTAQDVALSTALTPIAAFGLNKVFGKTPSKITEQLPTKKVVYSGEPVTKEALGGTKFYTPNKQIAGQYAELNKGVTGKSQVVEKDISNLNFKEVPQAEMQTALENPQIKQQYDGVVFKDVQTGEPSYAVFDKPTTKTPVTPEISGQPKVEAPNINPEYNKQVEDIAKTLETSVPENKNIPPELRLGDLKTRSENFLKEYSVDPYKMERVAMGIERHPTIPQEDALGSLMKIAKDNGDTKLLDRLTDSNVGSQAASNFNGLKLAGENNIGKVIRDLKLSIQNKFPQTFKKSIKETEESVAKLKQYMNENNIPDSEFSNLMDDFTCK